MNVLLFVVDCYTWLVYVYCCTPTKVINVCKLYYFLAYIMCYYVVKLLNNVILQKEKIYIMNYPKILFISVLRNMKSYYYCLMIYFIEFLVIVQFYFRLSIHNTFKYNILYCIYLYVFIYTLNYVLLLLL